MTVSTLFEHRYYAMRKLKLVIAYEGTSYVGWQRQAVGSSIQGCLEAALGYMDGAAVDAVAAGRTDAGVHALGQVVSVRLRRHIAVDAFVRGVNSLFIESMESIVER